MLMSLFLGAAGLAAAGTMTWRLADRRADAAETARLIALQPADPGRFDPAMVASLPEPARRYFQAAIRPGTPLATVALVTMTGQFSLGTRADPAYMPMRATQVLAAPHGFLWAMSARRGAVAVSGSDSGRWTRFWAAGLVPVARRSAFGRYVAEALFWTPAAMLPGPGVDWAAGGPDSARVTVTHGGLTQSVDIAVDPAGLLTEVSFDRWTDANPEHRFRLQRFGGYLGNHAPFAGFNLPRRVTAGNLFGSDDWFAFFVADVTSVTFPRPPA
jgi:hypothetical protein